MNVQGEEQQKLDVFANETMTNALNHTGRVCVMASEEDETIIPVPEQYPAGKYVVLFDPLDGSSNIDVNGAVGTIFSIYRRVSMEGRGSLADVLQPGCKQVAAGYVIYGSSTMLVYTTGQGVAGFTLDPSIGEFLLSHPEDRDARGSGRYYSVNESQLRPLEQGRCSGRSAASTATGPEEIKGKNSRYIGVAGGRLPPQPDRRRHLHVSRPTPRTRRASCACSTRLARWRSSPSRPAARPPTALSRILDILPDGPAPADAAGHRLAGGRGVRGRHAAEDAGLSG